MDAKRWVIAGTYVLMSVVIGGFALACVFIGQIELAKGLFGVTAVYMIGIPVGYVLYMKG